MGYGIKIFVPRPLHYVTRSPGPDCMIITTLEKGLEELGSYENVLKIQVKKGGHAPSAPPLNPPMDILNNCKVYFFPGQNNGNDIIIILLGK